MKQLQANLPHMVMGLAAMILVTVLAIYHIVTGGEALGVIGAASGFTMAASASYASVSGAVAPPPAVSVSNGQTVTETTAHTLSSLPAAPAA